jgi:ABC-2 type transport system ATP-binding protein
MLEARGLARWYGGIRALSDVTFRVEPGEIVGYLGPNGSGKSTTVNMVVGLLQPTAGTVTLDGLSLSAEPERYKALVGYVPEEPHVYTHLTAAEYLRLVGQLRGVPMAQLEDRIDRLLTLLQLQTSRFNAMTAFSKGMRQRVSLAAALIHNPRLLVLDEPFSGLDVNAGLMLRALLEVLASEGRMILFSTHRFDMAARLCSRVLMLSAGRVVHESAVDAAGTTTAESLEDIFVRVTQQADYRPLAREIFDAVAD